MSARMLVRADGSTVGTVGGGAAEARAVQASAAAMQEGQSRELSFRLVDEAQGDAGVCGGDMRLFVDVLLPRPTLLIMGGGHVGQAVAAQGALIGYRVVVMDERPELLTEERFPHAHERAVGDLAQLAAEYPFTAHTFVVMVTPHHSVDDEILAAMAPHPVPYVGLIGSRRRSALTFERARQRGVPDAFLQQVRTPIGLDIGAETPQEIAVSIIGEVIAAQRKSRKRS
jgi:xanthine dehydrogenase accessory factor